MYGSDDNYSSEPTPGAAPPQPAMAAPQAPPLVYIPPQPQVVAPKPQAPKEKPFGKMYKKSFGAHMNRKNQLFQLEHIDENLPNENLDKKLDRNKKADKDE